MPRPKKKKDRGRGFEEFWGKVEKKQSNMRYLASCQSCSYHDGEGCTNNSVTSFDMVKDETSNREYCTFWLPEGKKREDDSW